jgi:hypothetical protein
VLNRNPCYFSGYEVTDYQPNALAPIYHNKIPIMIEVVLGFHFSAIIKLCQPGRASALNQ